MIPYPSFEKPKANLAGPYKKIKAYKPKILVNMDNIFIRWVVILTVFTLILYGAYWLHNNNWFFDTPIGKIFAFFVVILCIFFPFIHKIQLAIHLSGGSSYRIRFREKK